MPLRGTIVDENGDVSWWAADVAADDSGETTLLGGDIRPTGAGYFHIIEKRLDKATITPQLL